MRHWSPFSCSLARFSLLLFFFLISFLLSFYTLNILTVLFSLLTSTYTYIFINYIHYFMKIYSLYCAGGAMVLSKRPVPGRPTIWIAVGQGLTALAVGAGGGCVVIFTLIYPFFPLSPSLWERVRYRLKYCLKGPLNPKQPTNQITILHFLLSRLFSLPITYLTGMLCNSSYRTMLS